MRDENKNASFWKYVVNGKIANDAPKEAKDAFRKWKQPYKPVDEKKKGK